MVHQLPTGARDLLPLDLLQKQWFEHRLQRVFHSWGYQPILTPTLEYLDSLLAGGTIDANTVIQVQGRNEEILGLRPEVTASIARAYASRYARDPNLGVQRLYYHANVFRWRGDQGQSESFQSGVELLGAGGVAADGEILHLLADCLKAANITGWKMVLGDAGLTTALINTFPESYRPAIRVGIAQLDRVALENLPLPDAMIAQVLTVLDLRGTPTDVFAKLTALPWLPVTSLTEIDYLQSLFYLWTGDCLLDLSLIQPFDYYTGIVFEVVLGDRILAQGGRYNHLLGIFHPQKIDLPSIGFCLNLEILQQACQAQLPQAFPPPDYLIAPQTEVELSAAFAMASQLRQQHPESIVKIALTSQCVTQARERGVGQILNLDTGEPGTKA
ncbi:MAG: ATP phosphoribosyltransferase regulatory subunit [Oscillatoriales cyanobacterium SM2_2_1]|nr:ATP phosphoribosyltransferase regulatory subunit [Oscillatoriales cyanobacterium SM2_2_1]